MQAAFHPRKLLPLCGTEKYPLSTMLAVYFLLLLFVIELNAQGPYVPVLDSLGTLPEFPDQRKIYDLTANGQIPPNAKAVLVYVFVTTLGDGNFQRGWYEISTRQGETKYSQFMNVATGQGLMAVNSGNLWFPFGDGKLDAKLSHPSDRKRSIAGKMADEDEEWSGVFVIGYRA